ncbi:type 1 glutamine amidotransferase [Paenibacillus sp. PDC88]|uniref:type 1 glutamine amidotransferase n=1 Tax=Paenibacillus sp. PDC88 TaxID=1884375 RepID=UPI0008948D3B|nr:type 1 glutamine amidotransferase [Paenibacillus sp. PDC88]SDW74377.1 GMP synthase-Glutamine amidotransferase [Paenibacillus sp. PDC88]
MKIIVFRHFSFDDPSVMVSWSKQAGHDLIIHDPANGIPQEWLHSFDLLVIQGGPMSVYQESKYPWLIQEKLFVKKAIEAGKKVLGICLGAQMIAEILGGAVSPIGVNKEIGWHQIHRNEERHPWLTQLPEHFISFSWHGDTFSLPEGARLLMYSEACGQQAFAYGDHVLALQFHLESTPDCIQEMLSRWSNELIDSPYIQHDTEIRQGMNHSEHANRLLRGILDQIQINECDHKTMESCIPQA